MFDDNAVPRRPLVCKSKILTFSFFSGSVLKPKTPSTFYLFPPPSRSSTVHPKFPLPCSFFFYWPCFVGYLTYFCFWNFLPVLHRDRLERTIYSIRHPCFSSVLLNSLLTTVSALLLGTHSRQEYAPPLLVLGGMVIYTAPSLLFYPV